MSSCCCQAPLEIRGGISPFNDAQQRLNPGLSLHFPLEKPHLRLQAMSAMWLWKANGEFRPYDGSISARIEDAYQKGSREVRVRLGAMDYSVDFKKMRQARNT